MKPGTHPTLSEYLLYEASKFLLYPHPSRERRTKTTVRDLELFDKSLGEIVEGRRTFDTHSGSKIKNDPVYLDDIYCREHLRAVPEMVRMTLKLRELSLPESESEWLIYLRESAKCLISGLPQATVALARAALEACLLDVYAKVPGNTAEALQETKITLGPLISKLSALYNFTKGTAGLSPEVKRQACEVKDAGDAVLHGRPLKTEKALEVYEAARSVILSVTGG